MDALDGLRGLAVFAVVAYHLRLPWFEAGFLGVDLFFVISGFLITHGLLERGRRQDASGLRAFYQRRLWRLYPAALVMIGLAFPLTAVFAPEALQRLKSDTPAGVLYLSNAWQLWSQQSYFETLGREPVLRHLWSLAVELHYYLVWPIVMMLVLRRFGPRVLAGLALLLAVASAGEMARLYGADPLHANFAYLATHTHAMGLLVGSALGCLAFEAGWMRVAGGSPLPRPARLLLPVAGILATLGLAAMVCRWNAATPWLYEGGFLAASGLAAVAIVSAVAQAGWWPRLLASAPLRWLGTRSYSIYLWHWPLCVWVFDGPGDVAAWQVVVVVVLSAGLGELSYRCVELAAKAQVQELARRFPAAFDGRNLRVGLVAVAFAVVLAGRLVPAPARAAASAQAPVASVAPAGNGPDTWASAPQATAADSASAAPEPSVPAEGDAITIVGDSVMLGARGHILRALPGVHIDAEVGRQFSEASRLIAQLRSRDALGQTVVLHLGTNGYIVERHFREALRQLEDRRRVVVVDIHAARRWTGQNNEIVERVSREFPNVVRVGWESIGRQNPQYFVQDGIHPNGAGIVALAAALAEAAGVPLSEAHPQARAALPARPPRRAVQEAPAREVAAAAPEAPADHAEPEPVEEGAQVP